MRPSFASTLGLVIAGGLACSKLGTAGELPEDMSAAAKALQSLDSAATVPAPASGQTVVVPSRPPSAPALPVVVLPPRRLQPDGRVWSRGSSTSSAPLEGAPPSVSAAHPDPRTLALPPAKPETDTRPDEAMPEELQIDEGLPEPPVPEPTGSESDKPSAVKQTPRTVSIQLHTSALQPLEGGLGVSVIQASVHSGHLLVHADVVNHGKTSCAGIVLRFWIEHGGRRTVKIAELRPAQSRSVKVGIRVPRHDRPDTIEVTSMGRLAKRSRRSSIFSLR